MSREEEFKVELKALLKKYQVEISIESSSEESWFDDYKIQFFSYPIYKDGDCIAGGIDIESTYFNGEGK